MKINSFIGFTPINEDGMMLAAWIDNKHKKYRLKEEIKEDEERFKRDLYVAPSQHFFYIPRELLITLPGDTIHAGGLCFGKKKALPVPRNKRVSHHMFQNHRLHFGSVCLRSATITSKVKPTTVYEDDQNDLYKD